MTKDQVPSCRYSRPRHADQLSSSLHRKFQLALTTCYRKPSVLSHSRYVPLTSKMSRMTVGVLLSIASPFAPTGCLHSSQPFDVTRSTYNAGFLTVGMDLLQHLILLKRAPPAQATSASKRLVRTATTQTSRIDESSSSPKSFNAHHLVHTTGKDVSSSYSRNKD